MGGDWDDDYGFGLRNHAIYREHDLRLGGAVLLEKKEELERARRASASGPGF